MQNTPPESIPGMWYPASCPFSCGPTHDATSSTRTGFVYQYFEVYIYFYYYFYYFFRYSTRTQRSLQRYSTFLPAVSFPISLYYYRTYRCSCPVAMLHHPRVVAWSKRPHVDSSRCRFKVRGPRPTSKAVYRSERRTSKYTEQRVINSTREAFFFFFFCESRRAYSREC